MSPEQFWERIGACLQNKTEIMLVAVAAAEGSSPGKPGFKMAAAGNGEIWGTIGGGIMEREAVETSRKELSDPGFRPRFEKVIHTESATSGRSGMICSGSQTLVFIRLENKDLPIVESLVQAIKSNRRGTLQLSPAGIRFRAGEVIEMERVFDCPSEKEWSLIEKIGHPFILSIIGGGHVSLALSRIMADLDFHIKVFDDRPEVETMKNNTQALQKIVCDYRRIKELIPEGERHFVVIMTFGHQSDEMVLEQLLEKKLGYLGMMGSQAKVGQIFKNLKRRGIDPRILKKVHAPIGLAINSHTPQEIAVSIAAQIIAVKNR